MATTMQANSAFKEDLFEPVSPGTATPAQVCEYRSAKRSRLDHQEAAAPDTACQARSRHVESWLTGATAQIKVWVADLGSHHPNCLEIPTDAVLRLSVAVLRVFLHSDLAGSDIPSTRPAAAAALWASIKFFAARKSLPSASFMSIVVGVDKAELIPAEVFLLELINWEVCALARSAGLDI